MSIFTGPLTLTHLDTDWHLWRIETPLTYEVGEVGSGNLITVPSGFISDGASVPRLLWWILPTWGKYSRAAVVHDYLWSLIRKGTPHPLAKTLKDADGIFLQAMKVCGVNAIIRYPMWAAVRVAGMVKGA